VVKVEGGRGWARNEHAMPIIRGDTSRGVHVRALAQAFMALIDALPPDFPSERRVRLRTYLALLRRTYPELQEEVELAQWLAEEDGDGLP